MRLSRIKEHLHRYQKLYSFLFALVFVIILLLIFQKHITNFVVDSVEKVHVNIHNPWHGAAFVATYVILFLPHPFGFQWIVTAITGFYYGWYYLLVSFVGIFIGVPVAYLFAINIKRFRKYLLNQEDIDQFRRAFNTRPKFMSFWIMFGPIPAQYQVLIPIWLDVHWAIICVFSSLADWFVLLPYGVLGVQATNIQQAVNSKSMFGKIMLPGLSILSFVVFALVGWQVNGILHANKYSIEHSEPIYSDDEQTVASA